MSVVSCHCGDSLLASYFHQVCLSWVNFLALLVSGNYASSISFESISNFTLCVRACAWYQPLLVWILC